LSSAAEEPRKKKIDGDVPSDMVAEILEVTSDPKKMLGPDVSTHTNTPFILLTLRLACGPDFKG